MLGRFFFVFLLLSASACSLFKRSEVSDKKTIELMDSIIATGEGKGRLGIGQHQYLFNFEAVLKENSDWLLAANIPLHGEEVLVLPNLTLADAPETDQPLELRIERGIKEYLIEQKQPPQLAESFMFELRSLMRLIMHKKVGAKLNCETTSDGKHRCGLDKLGYEAVILKEQLTLKKMLGDAYRIEYVAQNLTESIFRRGSVFLHSQKASLDSAPLLSLELFWQK